MLWAILYPYISQSHTWKNSNCYYKPDRKVCISFEMSIYDSICNELIGKITFNERSLATDMSLSETQFPLPICPQICGEKTKALTWLLWEVKVVTSRPLSVSQKRMLPFLWPVISKKVAAAPEASLVSFFSFSLSLPLYLRLQDYCNKISIYIFHVQLM